IPGRIAMWKLDIPPASFGRISERGAAGERRCGSWARDFFSSKTAVGCAVLNAKKSYHVAIVGATGAVGEELLRVLERRAFPVKRLVPLSSARSAGRSVSFRGDAIVAQELAADSFSGIDIAFFSAGGNISREYAP